MELDIVADEFGSAAYAEKKTAETVNVAMKKDLMENMAKSPCDLWLFQ
jgi:hypothetical protein